ncbi:MAG: hypothetical protein LCH84_06940 [Gemmatimonadetes bacterium]|nr:hypothetical protein [Gemmatimonadota bacterium]
MSATVLSTVLTPPRAGSPGGAMAGASLRQTQADAVRRDDTRGAGGHGVPTVLLASGRGGAGTSLVATLMAVAAAGDGLRVLLVDGDDLVGPLAMTLGVTPTATWRDLHGGRATPAEVALRVNATLTLVAGGAPRRDADDAASGAPLTAAERRACMRRATSLAAGHDLVVIDCGSRLDSVLAAVTPHAEERLVAVTAGSDPIAVAATYALCKATHARHGALPLDVLVNRHEGSDAARCHEAIDAGARQFLGVTLRFAGAVPADTTLDAALRAGMPFPDAAAGSPAAVAALAAVRGMLTVRSLSRTGA